MALLLKGARFIDPQVNMDCTCEMLIRDGKIVEVGHNLHMERGITKDLKGKIAIPGLIDMHVHLRDPGFEYKEDIISGTRAAAKGGFSGICSMPNTHPVTDTGTIVSYILSKAASAGKCKVYPCGACTKNLNGEQLAEMGDMYAHGARAFSDDGRGIQSSGMMRRVMEYAQQFGCVVMSHCQDESLVGTGQINEGEQSTRLGLNGWPALGEELQIQRDIELARLTGCALHIQHLSTAHGLDMVRRAKDAGVNVTCEVTPHHLFLNEQDIDSTYNTNFKVTPPLRTPADNEALRNALVAGEIDCVVTDHAPHAPYEKQREFEEAPFGMIGLETSLPSIITYLVNPGLLSWNLLVQCMAINPRKILGIEPVSFKAGSVADITVIDPNAEWKVSENDFESKACNSAFVGKTLRGRATDVYVEGYATLEEGSIVE